MVSLTTKLKTWLSHRRTKLTPKKNDHLGLLSALQALRGQITIMFDDGHSSVYTVAYPKMRDLKLRGVVAVTTGWIGTPSHMAWSELEALKAAGWEISSHGKNHVQIDDSTNEIILEDEILGSKLEFQRSSVTLEHFDPISYTYPYGKADRRVINIAKKYYLCGLSCSKEIANWGGYISSAFDLPRVYVTNDNINEVLTSVNEVKEKGGWLILFMHHVRKGGPISESNFQLLCETIKNNEIPVVTISEGLRLLNFSSFERHDPRYIKVFDDVYTSGTDSRIVSAIKCSKKTFLVKNNMDVTVIIKVYGAIYVGSTEVDWLQLGDAHGINPGEKKFIQVEEKVDFLKLNLTQIGRTLGAVDAWIAIG